MNDALAATLVWIASPASLICFILALIQMFQRGDTGIGIACIALTLCCGLGGLITFVYGWFKARQWNIVNLMTLWTIAFAIDVLAVVLNPTLSRILFGRVPLH